MLNAYNHVNDFLNAQNYSKNRLCLKAKYMYIA